MKTEHDNYNLEDRRKKQRKKRTIQNSKKKTASWKKPSLDKNAF
jgi:hypothetical protein